MSYHDCCNSFSKRGFAKSAGHPPLQSAYILKIPTLRTVSSPEELCNWLKNRMKEHRSEGRIPVFPTMNRHHTDMVEEKEIDNRDEQVESLEKMYKDLLSEKGVLERQIEKLQLDNSRLQASSKSWMKLYQDIMFKEWSDEERWMQLQPSLSLSTLNTPKKKTNPYLSCPEEH